MMGIKGLQVSETEAECLAESIRTKQLDYLVVPDTVESLMRLLRCTPDQAVRVIIGRSLEAARHLQYSVNIYGIELSEEVESIREFVLGLGNLPPRERPIQASVLRGLPASILGSGVTTELLYRFMQGLGSQTYQTWFTPSDRPTSWFIAVVAPLMGFLQKEGLLRDSLNFLNSLLESANQVQVAKYTTNFPTIMARRVYTSLCVDLRRIVNERPRVLVGPTILHAASYEQFQAEVAVAVKSFHDLARWWFSMQLSEDEWKDFIMSVYIKSEGFDTRFEELPPDFPHLFISEPMQVLASLIHLHCTPYQSRNFTQERFQEALASPHPCSIINPSYMNAELGTGSVDLRTIQCVGLKSLIRQAVGDEFSEDMINACLRYFVDYLMWFDTAGGDDAGEEFREYYRDRTREIEWFVTRHIVSADNQTLENYLWNQRNHPGDDVTLPTLPMLHLDLPTGRTCTATIHSLNTESQVRATPRDPNDYNLLDMIRYVGQARTLSLPTRYSGLLSHSEPFQTGMYHLTINLIARGNDQKHAKLYVVIGNTSGFIARTIIQVSEGSHVIQMSKETQITPSGVRAVHSRGGLITPTDLVDVINTEGMARRIRIYHGLDGDTALQAVRTRLTREVLEHDHPLHGMFVSMIDVDVDQQYQTFEDVITMAFDMDHSAGPIIFLWDVRTICIRTLHQICGIARRYRMETTGLPFGESTCLCLSLVSIRGRNALNPMIDIPGAIPQGVRDVCMNANNMATTEQDDWRKTTLTEALRYYVMNWMTILDTSDAFTGLESVCAHEVYGQVCKNLRDLGTGKIPQIRRTLMSDKDTADYYHQAITCLSEHMFRTGFQVAEDITKEGVVATKLVDTFVAQVETLLRSVHQPLTEGLYHQHTSQNFHLGPATVMTITASSWLAKVGSRTTDLMSAYTSGIAASLECSTFIRVLLQDLMLTREAKKKILKACVKSSGIQECCHGPDVDLPLTLKNLGRTNPWYNWQLFQLVGYREIRIPPHGKSSLCGI